MSKKKHPLDDFKITQSADGRLKVEFLSREAVAVIMLEAEKKGITTEKYIENLFRGKYNIKS